MSIAATAKRMADAVRPVRDRLRAQQDESRRREIVARKRAGVPNTPDF